MRDWEDREESKPSLCFRVELFLYGALTLLGFAGWFL